ncbi:MAG: acetylglutamate kinase [Anaerolineae bacterium]
MTQVIKIGGNELDDPSFVAGLVQVVKGLPEAPLLVHGGGKEIRTLQERLGLEPQYIDGLRVTDLESLAVVQMVLAGRINKRLVASLTAAGVDAFGMSGVDRGAVKAEKLEHPAGDLGWVGRVVSVRGEVFQRLLEENITPVLSPICWGADGSMFNVNADHVAMAIASALGVERLVFVSNVPGVLVGDQLVDHITPAQAETFIRDGIIVGGMLPKIRAALEAVASGVAAVCITNLQGLSQGTGTIVADSE